MKHSIIVLAAVCFYAIPVIGQEERQRQHLLSSKNTPTVLPADRLMKVTSTYTFPDGARIVRDSTSKDVKDISAGERFSTYPMPNVYTGDNCIVMPNAYKGDNCIPMPNVYPSAQTSHPIVLRDSLQKKRREP